MAQREFANQTALVAYAEQNDLAYEYEYTPAFAKWQRLLSPEQYEIVEARTSRGVSRVMLFSKAIIQAEWEANAPLREAMAIKRARLRALRAKRVASSVQLRGREDSAENAPLSADANMTVTKTRNRYIANFFPGRFASFARN
jgi:hypothetical protein